MQRLEPRELSYDGVHCSLSIEQYPQNIVVLRIRGTDVGEFGQAPMHALTEWLTGKASVEFFIDARDVRGASVEVSGEWAQWLSKHKKKLRSVTMLTGSRFIRITAEFVRRFSSLEGIMQICTEPEVFDKVLGDALSPVRPTFRVN